MTTSAKIALTTGGSRGLGKNMALRLAEEGKDVIVTYHSRKDAAGEVTAEIEKLGQKAVALQLDVGDIASLDGFVGQVRQRLAEKWHLDQLDILVNNAGIGATIPFEKAAEADFNNAAVRSNPELNAYIASQTALGRVGQADDIGKVVAFLASDKAYWINGQRIEASGGMFL